MLDCYVISNPLYDSEGWTISSQMMKRRVVLPVNFSDRMCEKIFRKIRTASKRNCDQSRRSRGMSNQEKGERINVKLFSAKKIGFYREARLPTY